MRINVLLITGGEPRRIRNSIGGKCANIIRKFISNGGGYIGICAGAVLATRKSPTLDLLPMVKCINDNIWWASGIEGTVLLKRVKNKFLSYQDKKLLTTFVPEIKGTPHFYFNGPLLGIKQKKKQNVNIIPLSLFSGYVNPWKPLNNISKQPLREEMNNCIASLAGHYNKGKIIITSIHPEFLESNELLKTMCLYVSKRTNS